MADIEDYVPTPWVNETAPAINAVNLLNMENGIFAATEAIKALQDAGAGYTLPPASTSDLGGVKIELIDNGDGSFTGRIWV